MPTDIVMPQMGESIFEGTITKWLKQPGDKVQRDEPLFEISTDKVDAEIPAPASGTLQEIKVEAGNTVQVNTVVGVIGDGDAAAATAPPKAAAAPAPEVKKEAAPAAPSAPAAKAPEPESEPDSESGEQGRVRSSPLVRKIAKENNVDLAKVPGTGLGGRITKEDIEAFIAKHAGVAPAAAAPAPAAPTGPGYETPSAPAVTTPLQPVGGVTPGELVPMTTMRKKIAEHMLMSKRTSAHVHGVFEIDMTRVVRLREKMKSKFEQATGNKLTYTPFFCRAAVHGLRKWPIVNSSVEGDNIRYHSSINLGIAVALDWGLIVPVIKSAEERSFVGLQRAVTDLGERARSKKLRPEEVQGGTFTITNPGIFGAKFGMPIISQPQVAIMGIGGIVKKPVVLTDKDGNDTIAIRSMMHMSIGYDHRIIDGAVADQFMMEVKKFLENWNEELL
jgi:pyruvate dehydrogenase E2 component (dihydrolipoyllysine-residue acetyltransferase)